VFHLTLDQPSLEPFRQPGPAVGTGQPWGVELASGEHCVASQGAHEVILGKRISRVVDYGCSSRTGRPESPALLRGIDRSRPLWRIATAYSTKGGRLKIGPKVGIVKAWYAMQE
jgi:hypothetical protein